MPSMTVNLESGLYYMDTLYTEGESIPAQDADVDYLSVMGFAAVDVPGPSAAPAPTYGSKA